MFIALSLMFANPTYWADVRPILRTHCTGCHNDRNLADKEYLQEVIVAPEFGGAFIHDSPGLSYGLDVSYSFK